ncbi:MAG TPA: N-acetylmuramoyl-L-alanine amidase [Veillonellaceae bacterium]|jgi:N-acetylmuramoyl-L-alanine amidase|nr:N-acetylmuramoyl-L-alanine amidase [Veillonellaceae bacterium]
MKRFFLFLLFCAMAFLMIPSHAQAAAVTDFRWTTRNDGNPPFVRIVMDLTDKVQAEAALDKSGKNFEVILRNTAMPGQPKDYQMDPSIMSLVTTSQQGKDLYLDVALTESHTMKDIKVFSLPANIKAHKPQRLVVDIPRIAPSYNSASPQNYEISPSDARVLKGKIICIDPGHGGTDTGAIGQLNGQPVYEKNITLSIALPLRDMLTKAGATVFMTRTTDRDVYKPYDGDNEELQARSDVGNNNHADAFLSIHIDAFSNPSVDGTTGYYYAKTDKDQLLAQSLHDAVLNEIDIPDRGVRANDLYVNVHTNMPSTLQELGYISNPDRVAMLTTPGVPEKIAKSLFDGFVAYFSKVDN